MYKLFYLHDGFCIFEDKSLRLTQSTILLVFRQMSTDCKVFFINILNDKFVMKQQPQLKRYLEINHQPQYIFQIAASFLTFMSQG